MRIIRDPVSLVGKGIGYMLFKDRDCVLKALALHKVTKGMSTVSPHIRLGHCRNTTTSSLLATLIEIAICIAQGVFKKRWALRVTACGKRTKRAEQEKRPPTAASDASADAEEGATTTAGDNSKRTESGKKDRWRDRAEGDHRSAKRSRGPSPAAEGAMRRIKHKV